MITTLNRDTYEMLIVEDVEWLLDQPESPARDRIETLLWDSPCRQYDEDYTGTPFPKVEEDDLAWLLKRPHSLERMHAIEVLREALGPRRSLLGRQYRLGA